MFQTIHSLPCLTSAPLVVQSSTTATAATNNHHFTRFPIRSLILSLLSCSQKAAPEQQASRAKLLAITISNFGCFYQKSGDPGLALEYLGKALAIERLPGSGGSPAGTLLNICAVLSTLGRHE